MGFTANPGAGGDTFASDLVSGEQVPYSKIAIGAAGALAPVNAANPLPTSVASLPLPAGAATQTTLATVASAVYAEDSPAADGAPGVFMLAIRRDSDTATAADGDYTALKMDEAGRLKVATQPGLLVAVTGNITAAAQTVFALVERASNVTITMVATSLVGHNASFEFSLNSTNGTDGNWYAMQVVRTNANTIELVTGVLTATPAYGWEASVNAYKYIRIRATAHTSGTAAYIIHPGSYATEPIPAAQVSATQPISGAVTLTSTTVTASTPATPTASNISSAATTNAAFLKASAGTLYALNAFNAGASPAYIKLYNQTTAPTVGTSVPVIVLAVPATGTANLNLGAQGHRFVTGIAIAITGGAADTDTTAVALAQVKVITSFI